MTELIWTRRAEYLMWRRIAARRKRGTRSYWRAAAHEYSAAMLLDFAYRLAAGHDVP